MKLTFLKIVSFLLVFSGTLLGQNIEDVIYLKNGSVIKGLIVERVPNDYIKIQSGQNTFVYKVSEIEKFTKEITTNKLQPNTGDFITSTGQNRTIGINFGTGVLNEGNVFANQTSIINDGWYYYTETIPSTSPKTIGINFGLPFREKYFINLSVGYGFGKSRLDRNYTDEVNGQDREYEYNTKGFPMELELLRFAQLSSKGLISPFIGLGFGYYNYTTELKVNSGDDTSNSESTLSGFAQYFTFGMKVYINPKYSISINFKRLGFNNILYKYDMLDSDDDEIGKFESNISGLGLIDLGMSIGISYNY